MYIHVESIDLLIGSATDILIYRSIHLYNYLFSKYPVYLLIHLRGIYSWISIFLSVHLLSDQYNYTFIYLLSELLIDCLVGLSIYR